jgi:phosphoserine phosphatase
MSGLHVFDMDGTLLLGAATVEFSRYLGCFEVANAVEEAWVRGEIDDIPFWEQRWGAGAVFGARVEPGRRCEEDLLLTVQHKVDITAVLLADLGLTKDECVAYGDSTSDVLLFEWLPHTVAVNAKPVVRDIAAAVYDGPDLRNAYATGRALLDGDAGAASARGTGANEART